MYGIIYKATNKINGKVYIGQTINGLEKRKQSHIWDAFRMSGNKFPFQHALRKYGSDSFAWEVIDMARDKDQLNEKEIYWIAVNHAYGANGYNATPGGGSGEHMTKPVLQYDCDGNYIKRIESATKAAMEVGVNPGDVGRCCNRTDHHSIKGYIYLFEKDWINDEERNEEVERRILSIKKHEKRSGGKAVIAFSTDLSLLFFTSVYKAGKELGVERQDIRDVLKNNRRNANGYVFYREVDVPPIKSSLYKGFLNEVKQRLIPSKHVSRVLQYSYRAEKVAIYENAKEAGKKNGWKNYTNILQSCDQKKMTAFGFIWLMEKDFPTALEQKREVKRRTSILEGSSKRKTTVYAIDLDGNFHEFDSKIACAEMLMTTRATVSRLIKTKAIGKGKWFLFDELNYSQDEYLKRKNDWLRNNPEDIVS